MEEGLADCARTDADGRAAVQATATKTNEAAAPDLHMPDDKDSACITISAVQLGYCIYCFYVDSKAGYRSHSPSFAQSHTGIGLGLPWCGRDRYEADFVAGCGGNQRGDRSFSPHLPCFLVAFPLVPKLHLGMPRLRSWASATLAACAAGIE